jgi:hypothetical protein
MPLEDKDKVAVLLAEYNSLRTWIFARVNNGYQLIAVGPAIIALVLTQTSGWVTAFTLGGGIGLLLVGLFLSWLHVHEAGPRMIELELLINKMAGEPLLMWEQQQGGLLTRRLVKFVKDKLKRSSSS